LGQKKIGGGEIKKIGAIKGLTRVFTVVTVANIETEDTDG
jgi:hypothetical protein